jgi:hypothetical protein
MYTEYAELITLKNGIYMPEMRQRICTKNRF